jgi:DNA-binding LacI/PurR family transcriptional regulator
MTTPRSIPTLDDVARVAGVSTATVSRCLNEEQKVSAKTRERVMKVINELGYTPNFNARAMAAKRTNTIGAIIPTMENAIFARGLQAFQETLYASGYNLLRVDRKSMTILKGAAFRQCWRGPRCLIVITLRSGSTIVRRCGCLRIGCFRWGISGSR